MNNINICYIINDNKKYIELTLKSISYIQKFFKNSNYSLNFFIISENKIKLPAFIKNIITPYKDIPLLWQRIYIPQLLKVSRCIFLDSDTITMTCISKLWEINLNGNITGAVKSFYFEKIKAFDYYNLNFEPFNKITEYYNCGVQIIDCKKWEENNITVKMLKLYNDLYDNKHEWYKMDEPVYNAVLSGNVQTLNKKWNLFPGNRDVRPGILHYYGIYTNKKPVHNEFDKNNFI